MINHILKHDNKSLQLLRQTLDQLNEFNRLLAEYLDAESARHCKVVKFEKNCLFVMTTNGAWATQLRFQIPELMLQLKQHPLLSHLKGIICKTHPMVSHRYTVTSQRRKVKKLSLESANSILEAAKAIKDERLRKILERIAENVS